MMTTTRCVRAHVRTVENRKVCGNSNKLTRKKGKIIYQQPQRLLTTVWMLSGVDAYDSVIVSVRLLQAVQRRICNVSVVRYSLVV